MDWSRVFIIVFEHLLVYLEVGWLETLYKNQTQKQPLEVFYEKRCSWKFHKSHKETSVLQSLFLIKLQAAGLQFFQKRGSNRVAFLRISQKILRTPSLQNTSGWLFLQILTKLIKSSFVMFHSFSHHMSNNENPLQVNWHVWLKLWYI